MEKPETCVDLKSIKKEYKELGIKYKLPEFEALAEDFDIEKILEKETSFLLREIRRAISDKSNAYLHLFETLINPTSPPVFIFSILKNVGEKDQKSMREVYKKLAKAQIQIMKLDTIYSEENEAEFIKNFFDEWQELKTKICDLVNDFEKKLEGSNNSKKRGYLG